MPMDRGTSPIHAERSIAFAACLIVLLSIIAGAPIGCAGKPKTAAPPISVKVEAIDAVALQSELFRFADEFRVGVVSAATAIATNTQDRGAREAALVWKLRTIPAMETAVLQPDVRWSLVSVWAICIKQAQYLEGGRGRRLFADQQEHAVQAARDLERDISEIAAEFLPPELYEDAREEINAFASDVPIISLFSFGTITTTLDDVSKKGGLGAIFALPLAPFTGMQGVGNTPSEVRRFGLIVAEIAQMLERQPEYIRWHLEILLLESQSLEVVQRFVQLTESVQQIVQIVDDLPEDIGNEINTAIEASRQANAEFRETLADARAVVGEFDNAVEDMDSLVDNADELAELVVRAAEELDDTASAVNDALARLETMLASRPSDQPAEPFTMHDLAATVSDLRDAAAHLRTTVEQLDEAHLDSTFQKFDRTADATLARADAGLRAVVSFAFWRLLLLGLLLIVAAAAARAFLPPKSAGTKPPSP